MKEDFIIIAAVLFPIFMGTILLFLRKRMSERRAIHIYVGVSLVTEGILVSALLLCSGLELAVFELMENVPVLFKLDGLGKLFVAIAAVLWILAGFYSFVYMGHEKNEGRYFGFYLIVFGVLVGLGCAGNLVTMYAFYEFMTLASFSLVIHNQSKEAVMAALKYLLYSLFGAYMALFGLFFLSRYAKTFTFTPGGALDAGLLPGHVPLMLLAAFLMIMGFGVKAGMFPMHAWLTAAHPVAPAPASAVLSGIMVKSGAFAVIRTVFYLFGADFIRGTWVQSAFLSLSLLTVFIGSMLAFHEKGLKKRLAYSTVSQVSYILSGIAFLEPAALTGALLHMAAHAMIKCTLFLAAGAVIYKTGVTAVDGMTGIGKKMPVTIWCFTIVSLGLTGIPPTAGFISKWYLAAGALDSGAGIFCVLGPAVLLLSALLTAGYLFPIMIKGFFPGQGFDYGKEKRCEAGWLMLAPMIVLTALSVLAGMFPNALLGYINTIVDTLM